jgi:hypothetical protein
MTPARSVPTASAEHAVPDRVERLMSELKADLIRLARIPWVTFPESALGRIADAFETAGAKPAGFVTAHV